jgi:membrane protease YdiL (CAAX protease family)
MRALVLAAAEAFGALMAVELATSFAASLLPALPAAGGGPLRLAVLAAVAALAYGRRFRPTGSAGAALASGARAVAHNFGLRLGGGAALLLAFHAAQLAAAFALHGGAASLADAGRCLSLGAWLWSPLLEELLSRFLLFYVSFQRSGGNLLFSVMVGACIFGLMHMWNVAALGFSVLTALQVLLGVVAGSTYGAVFARTGSVPAVWALHAANNVVAFVWMALQDDTEGGVDGGADGGGGACLPRFSTALLVLLCAQLVVYSGVCAAALKIILVGSAASPAAVADFKAAHPLIYDVDGGNGGGGGGGARPTAISDGVAQGTGDEAAAAARPAGTGELRDAGDAPAAAAEAGGPGGRAGQLRRR